MPPLPPMTRRAELGGGRARAQGGSPAGAGAGLALGPRPAVVAPGLAGMAEAPLAPGAGGNDIYLMATDRSTGQPPPPEAGPGPAEALRGERPGRVAIGLSGA